MSCLDDILRALSTNNIIDPLFIIQGANNPRVNKAKSDQKVEALERISIPVARLFKETTLYE